jgi:hypothetical protein
LVASPVAVGMASRPLVGSFLLVTCVAMTRLGRAASTIPGRVEVTGLLLLLGATRGAVAVCLRGSTVPGEVTWASTLVAGSSTALRPIKHE